LGLA
jgi:hypothetical protein